MGRGTGGEKKRRKSKERQEKGTEQSGLSIEVGEDQGCNAKTGERLWGVAWSWGGKARTEGRVLGGERISPNSNREGA